MKYYNSYLGCVSVRVFSNILSVNLICTVFNYNNYVKFYWLLIIYGINSIVQIPNLNSMNFNELINRWRDGSETS